MSASNQDIARVLKARDYKSGIKPIWCPGCGHFSVLNALTKAFSALQLRPENIAILSGIGCSARLPAYASAYGFHGLHGRALALAAGVKVSRPDLTVVAVGGDGDGFSIGANHLLHACRRNVDFTYVVMDNQIYGMTKGQASPTTPIEISATKLTPYGTGVGAMEPVRLAMAAGASFVARGYFGDPNQTARLIAEAIRHPGFALVHVLSQCPTFVPEQSAWKGIVHQAKDVDEAAPQPETASDDGFTLGVLHRERRAVFPPQWTRDPGKATLDAAAEFAP